MSEESINESEKDACPQCGAAMPDDATGGLCPVCLMAAAMEPTAPVGNGQPEPPSIEEVQAEFPQLEILEIIGVGGMGVVYKAKQTSLNRDVALKLLAPHRETEAGFSERFTREAQALAAMNHPNIVTVHDFGQAGDFFYLLMEFVDGVNLRQGMKAGKFTPEEALAIVPPICDALQYAHDQGIVHRDIKPENLLLDKAGKVKVADFGIARILNLKEPEADETDFEPGAELTAGAALGTPNYMAPEQVDAPGNVDHRADIYSLGVVFYEMLTGERPAAGVFQPPSSRVAVDVRLDEIVLRALADSPELRWQTATDLRTQVQTVVDGPKPPPLETSAPTRAAVPAATPAVVSKPGNVWKWVSLGLGLLSIPVVILGVIALIMVADDPDWNPNPTEGILTWSLWLGALALIAGTAFTFIRSLRDESKEARKRRIRMVSGALLLVAGLLLPVIIFVSAMRISSRDAMASAERARAEQAQFHAANQEAFRLRVELNEIENRMSRDENAGKDAAQVARMAEARVRLADAEQAVQEARAKINNSSSSSRTRLSVGLFILGGLFSLALIVTGTVFLAKSLGAVVVGCGIVMLFVFVLGIGLVMSYFTVTKVSESRIVYDEGGFPQRETIAEARVMPDAVSFEASEQAITTGANSTAVFSFRFTTGNLPKDWLIWQQTRYFRKGESEPYKTTSTELGTGGSTSIPLRDVKLGAEQMNGARSMFVKHSPGTVVAPGKPLRIFHVVGEDGTKIEIDVELRPSSERGKMLFLRACEPDLENGRIRVVWNETAIPANFDLVLETRGTVAFKRGEDVDDAVRLDFSRRILRGDQNLTFVFPEVYNLPRNDARFPKPWRLIELSDTEYGISLFGFNDPQTGHRVSARLKLVAAGSVEEILPESLSAEAESEHAGAPLPLPPDGASFVAERHIVFPGDVTMRVATDVRDRDQPSTEMKGESVIFKSPIDDARGIYLRWRAYPPDHETHASHYIIDLVAAPTGVIFHRFEGEFPRGVKIFSPDIPPLPETMPHAQIDREGTRLELNLIRAEETVPPGTPVSQWWNVRAEIEWIRNATGERAPAYQLPASGDVLME